MARYIEVKTTGPIEWARVFEYNRDMDGFEGQYTECEGAYTVNQILDKDEFEKLKKAGTMKKPKPSRLMDGEIVIKFERKHKVTNRNGELVAKACGAPKVVGPDGQDWDGENHPLGNGTVAEVTNLLSQFTTRDGKTGYRTSLVAIKVLDYVPVPEREDDEAA